MEAGGEPGVFLRSFRVLEELVGGLVVGKAGTGGDKHKITATRTKEAFGNSGLRPPHFHHVWVFPPHGDDAAVTQEMETRPTACVESSPPG